VSALLSLYTWAEMAIIAIVGFPVQSLVALVTVPFDRGRKVAGRFLRWEAVLAAKSR
jgi:1-acyl-sn-glycerol-3-phosphate acyltransferase